MTERERILSVFYGEKPDRVPFMLDLSHYYYQRFKKDWDLCNGYSEPERDLIDFNRRMGAGFYIPNQAIFIRTTHDSDVRYTATRTIVNGVPEIAWKYETPIGSIERIRVWEPGSYSWAIKKWGVTDGKDLEILSYAMKNRHFELINENYKAWADYVGDDGLVYMNPGYSAIGYLLNYWMGIENTIYASDDYYDELRACVDSVNNNILELIYLIASKNDAPVIIMGDNFSCDVQPPNFFNEWSRDFYAKAADIIHSFGKKLAVHIDGKLKGAIEMIRDAGADCIDAVTPGSVGGITAAEARDCADSAKAKNGGDLILSGGIPNELWYENFSEEEFENAVIDWLKLKERSTALISAAGDQVPPGAMGSRILKMRDLVNEHGWY